MKHRKLSGIDKTLAEIIDRSLHVDPSERFENVQQVLDALSARERQRTQKPLVTFGVLGPLALLLGMVAVGVWVWGQAESGARDALTQQTLESDLGTARVIGAVVDRNLSAVQRRVAREAGRRELRALVTAEAVTSNPSDKEILHAEIQAYTASLHDDYKDRHFHNWVVADRGAVVIARSPYDKKVVGSNYAFREWFTGKAEVKPEDVPPDFTPRDEVSLTLAFKSTAEGNPVLISVASPIRSLEGDEVLGVLSATLHLVTFNEWLETSEGNRTDDGCPPRLAILVNRDQLVRHPCPAETAPKPPVAKELFFETSEVQALMGETDATLEEYHDPLRPGETYLAAYSRLEENSDWFAIVQHDRSVATAPVTQLAGQIQWLGWMALCAGLLGVGVLWFLLFRVTHEAVPFFSRKPLTKEPEAR
jgi:hypothetical protein